MNLYNPLESFDFILALLKILGILSILAVPVLVWHILRIFTYRHKTRFVSKDWNEDHFDMSVFPDRQDWE